MLIKAAFHTGIWTVVFFVLGMINPKWPLFFMKKPDRFLILVITTVLVMVSVTMFGEGNRQKREEEQSVKEVVSKIVEPASAPVPVPDASPKK